MHFFVNSMLVGTLEPQKCTGVSVVLGPHTGGAKNGGACTKTFTRCSKGKKINCDSKCFHDKSNIQMSL